MMRKWMVAATMAVTAASILGVSPAARAAGSAPVTASAVTAPASASYTYYGAFFSEPSCRLVGAGGALHGNWTEWYCIIQITPQGTTWQLFVQ
jgi:hypothetical protein